VLTHTEQVELPYTQRQVFDLVADIESYAQFLPSVISARILKRDGNTLWVTQLVRFTILPLTIATRAVFDPHASIRIVCDTSKVVRFTELWTFTPNAAGGTTLRSHTEYEFRSELMRRTLQARFNDLQGQTMRAFAARSRALYGSEKVSAGWAVPAPPDPPSVI
jgi:coenzyme Q-binding protein COQ10